MKRWGIILLVIGAIILLIGLSFGLGFWKMAFKSTFEPMEQDIEREVFENTKSYVQGKIQDLSNYYEEYQKADAEDRVIIRNVIQMQFAGFEKKDIDNETLKSFLVNMRGF